MALPHPSAIRRQCAEVRALLDEHDRNGLPKLYRTVHNVTFDRLRSEGANVKSPNHDSDPTGQIASGLVPGRKPKPGDPIPPSIIRRQKVDSATALLQTAFGNIRAAQKLLLQALPDQRSIQETAPELDSAVGPGYVKAQREQQRKRQLNAEQGPMWSESSEVV